MKKLKQIILSFALVTGFAGAALLPAPVSAINVFDQCSTNSDAAVCGATSDNAESLTKNLINTMLFVLGIIAVIMIVIGGIRYAVSGGDSSSVSGAKDTIMYAVIGLVVAILAYAIVNFVLDQF